MPSMNLEPEEDQKRLSSEVERDCTAAREEGREHMAGTGRDGLGRGRLAAAFAAKSARSFPFAMSPVPDVCAAHLQTAIAVGNKMASNSSAIRVWCNTGLPSDLRKFLCLHSAPKS